jgi:integrase
VGPRTLVNGDQARRLLAAVGQHGELGERMVAFFGCLYYAALRPEEAVDLRRDNAAASSTTAPTSRSSTRAAPPPSLQ